MRQMAYQLFDSVLEKKGSGVDSGRPGL